MGKKELQELKEKVLKLQKAGDIEKILKYKTAYERFNDMAIQRPDSPAILYMGNTITYGELSKLIDNAANGFSQLGIKYNDVVTMSMLSTPYSVVAFYALDKIGAVMHMVNSATNLNEIKRELANFDSKYFVANDIFCNDEAREALQQSGIKTIVTTSLLDSLPAGFSIDKVKYSFIEKIKGLDKKVYDNKTVFTFNQLLDIGRKSEIKTEPCKFSSNKMATVAYTSGSTGDSKACVATWEGLDSMVQIMAMTEEGRFERGDVMFTTFPLWIYYSLLNMIHEPLCLGVALAFDPLFAPTDIVKRNNLYHFNHWLTIPPYIKTMVKMNKKTDCSKWKIILTGGDALLDEVKLAGDKYIKENNGSVKIAQGYGASECLGSFAYCYHENPTLGSVGIPCVGNRLKVIDIETGKELGPNQMGVGYFYTAARMKEYYGDVEATKHNLVKDENGVVWYNSEDLLHYNERGEIFLDGRIRRIVLTLDSQGKPTKIIPDKMKKVISHMDQVSNCEVITLPDDISVNKGIACVVLNSNFQPNSDVKQSIIDYCKENLPEYMVPRDIMFMEEMPLTPAKKPDLKCMEEMYNNSFNQNEKNNKVKKLLKK